MTNELLKIQDPRLSPKLLKLKQAAGSFPKRIPATRIKPIIATHRNDAFAAALGLTGSSMTGNTKTLAVGIYEELSE